ncbi:hypothetical protein [Rhodosalinus sediminis]|uniref:hypothetical protein n=1 Tax=Rhodosalinus sediminis TaxID=1940533 RepID=UPI002357B872|nr:hypothetical protein [Rhodosalinus sediminis]
MLTMIRFAEDHLLRRGFLRRRLFLPLGGRFRRRGSGAHDPRRSDHPVIIVSAIQPVVRRRFERIHRQRIVGIDIRFVVTGEWLPLRGAPASPGRPVPAPVLQSGIPIDPDDDDNPEPQ